MTGRRWGRRRPVFFLFAVADGLQDGDYVNNLSEKEQRKAGTADRLEAQTAAKPNVGIAAVRQAALAKEEAAKRQEVKTYYGSTQRTGDGQTLHNLDQARDESKGKFLVCLVVCLFFSALSADLRSPGPQAGAAQKEFSGNVSAPKGAFLKKVAKGGQGQQQAPPPVKAAPKAAPAAPAVPAAERAAPAVPAPGAKGPGAKGPAKGNFGELLAGGGPKAAPKAAAKAAGPSRAEEEKKKREEQEAEERRRAAEEDKKRQAATAAEEQRRKKEEEQRRKKEEEAAAAAAAAAAAEEEESYPAAEEEESYPAAEEEESYPAAAEEGGYAEEEEGGYAEEEEGGYAEAEEEEGAWETCTAIGDWAAQSEGDLAFSAGDTIWVVDRASDPTGWWTGQDAAGVQGSFPSTYVRLDQ